MSPLTADPTVWMAVGGIATAIVSGFTAIAVAMINSKKERGATADAAVVQTLRERIVLRDEQIASRDHTIEQLEEQLQLYKDGRLPDDNRREHRQVRDV